MSTDVQTPFLGTPLVPLRYLASARTIQPQPRQRAQHHMYAAHICAWFYFSFTPVHPIFSLSLAKLYVKPTRGIVCGFRADIHADTMSRGHAAKMSSPKMSALYIHVRIRVHSQRPSLVV